jgi:hypothetical protein
MEANKSKKWDRRVSLKISHPLMPDSLSAAEMHTFSSMREFKSKDQSQSLFNKLLLLRNQGMLKIRCFRESGMKMQPL